jgi:protease-4
MTNRRRSRRFGRLVVGAAVLFGALAVLRFLASEAALPFQGPAVGVVDVRGVIGSSDDIVAALKRFRTSKRIGAVLLRVDSPGGAVAPAQEIYDEIGRVREEKPVVASLGNLAASGGYYVASACHPIVANPGTVTGSIGVIMAVRNIRELADWAGIDETIIKSGPYKDITSPMRTLTPEEKVILQEMVDDVYTQFVSAVAAGRRMSEEAVRRLADGRVYSGAQALNLGMVDQLGGYEDAVQLAATAAGIEGEPRTVRADTARRPWWAQWFGQVLGFDAYDWMAVTLPDGLFFLYQGPGLGLR